MNIRIDNQLKISFVDIGTATDTSALKKSVTALLAHPDHVDKMDSIFDLSNAEFNTVNQSDMQEYAHWLAPFIPRIAERTAIVAKRDLEFGLARMWMVHSDGVATQQRNVFRNIESAIKWLIDERK